MSVDNLPEPEDAIMKFEEKTPLATMVSGGVFVAVAVYFIIGWVLSIFDIDLQIIQWAMVLIVILISINLGLKPETVVRINRKTGWVEAESSGVRWKGYANAPERLMVLERQIEGRGGSLITEYKLNIMLSEDDQFNVYLNNQNVRQAIQWIDDAKKAVSAVQKTDQIQSA